MISIPELTKMPASTASGIFVAKEPKPAWKAAQSPLQTLLLKGMVGHAGCRVRDSMTGMTS